MDHAAGMSVGDGAPDFQQKLDRLVSRKLAVPRHVLFEREGRIWLYQTASRGLFLDIGLVRTGHVLHDDERTVLVLAQRIDMDDVHVAERGDRPCLVQEALTQRGDGLSLAVEALDRHKTPEAAVAGEIDHAHAAVADLAVDRVLIKQLVVARLVKHRLIRRPDPNGRRF